MTLSPGPKVNRTTSGGMATIFFDSSIEDLSIVCTEEEADESIIKINDHQWFVNIDVNKDIETDGVCYRNYLLKCSASAEYFLTTDEIIPNQVLYYTITLPNELQPKILKALADRAEELVDKGDSYLARMLALEALPTNLDNPEKPYVPEAERALRRACLQDNAMLNTTARPIQYREKAVCFADSLLVVESSFQYGSSLDYFDIKTGKLLKSHDFIIPNNNLHMNNHFFAHYDDKCRIWIYELNDTLISLSFSDKDNVRILELPDGFAVEKSSIDFIRFSEDENYVVSYVKTLDNDSTAHLIIYDFNNEKDMTVLDEIPHDIDDVSFSADNRYIFTKNSSDKIQLWSLDTGHCTCYVLGEFHENNYAFNPDSKQLYLIDDNGNLEIVDLLTGRLLKTIRPSDSPFELVKYDSERKQILTTSSNHTESLWSAATGEHICDFSGGYQEEKNFVFVPNSNIIASFSNQDTSFVLRDAESGKLIDMVDIGSPFTPLLITKNILVYESDERLFLRGLKNYIEKPCYNEEAVSDYVICTAGSIGVVQDDEKENFYRIKNVEKGEDICEITCPEGEYGLKLSKDGDIMVSYNSSTIHIYNTSSGKCVGTIDVKTSVGDLSLNNRGTRISVSDEHNRISIYELNSGKCFGDFFLPINEKCEKSTLSCVHFIADDTKLIANVRETVSDDNYYEESDKIYVLDAFSGEIVDTIRLAPVIIQGYFSDLTSVDISPDGNYLLTTYHNGFMGSDYLRVWDKKTMGLVFEESDLFEGFGYSFKDGSIIISLSDSVSFLFPPLQQLIDETRERFKSRSFSEEEKAMYHIE